MHHDHLPIFPVLSMLVAVFGAWTALHLHDRARVHEGRIRLYWVMAAAAVMGSALWTMHFIAMLGFDPGSPVRYDPGLTVLSMLLAMLGTGAAFLTASWRSQAPALIGGGVVMGLSIGLMHYVGMAALRTAASLGYRPSLVAISLAIAVAASIAALFAARRDQARLRRFGAAVILGVAVVGMHYTAMQGLVLTPAPEAGPLPGAPPVILAVAVAALAMMMLLAALMAAIHDQRQNLLDVIDAGGVGYWELHIPTRTLKASVRAKQLFGVRADRPFSQADLESRLSAETAARRREALDAVLSGVVSDYDQTYELADSGRWIQVRGAVTRDGAGRPLRLSGVALDVTDRQAAFKAVAHSEHRQRLLINELNHRVKNTLATIQSIAALTARRAKDVDSFSRTFEARLLALSATQNLLTAQSWDRVGLRSLLEQELRPYAEEQVRLKGPNVCVASEQALSLGMVFHELATNAAKYGALSTPDGCVEVAWKRQSDEVILTWAERDGPLSGRPGRAGFGSRLIATAVEGILRGRVTMTYEPKGFKGVFHLRLDAADQASQPEAPGQRLPPTQTD